MPAGNGTGPMGMGPMTGRGAGFCSGAGTPGYANGGGFGYGGGYGGGFGRRNRFFATAPRGRFVRPMAMDPINEKQALQNQADALQAQLENIKKRLEDIG